MQYEADILKAEKGYILNNLPTSEVKKMYKSIHNYISFTLPATDTELAAIAEAFKTAFGHWRIAEIMLAIQMSIAGQIAAQVNSFGEPLAPNHLRDVMQEYRKVKSETMLKFARVEDKDPELSQAEMDKIMTDGINQLYREFLRDENTLLQDNYIWHHNIYFLSKMKKIQVSDEDMKRAKEQAVELSESKDRHIRSLIGRVDKLTGNIGSLSIVEKLTYYVLVYNYFAWCKHSGYERIF